MGHSFPQKYPLGMALLSAGGHSCTDMEHIDLHLPSKSSPQKFRQTWLSPVMSEEGLSKEPPWLPTSHPTPQGLWSPSLAMPGSHGRDFPTLSASAGPDSNGIIHFLTCSESFFCVKETASYQHARLGSCILTTLASSSLPLVRTPMTTFITCHGPLLYSSNAMAPDFSRLDFQERASIEAYASIRSETGDPLRHKRNRNTCHMFLHCFTLRGIYYLLFDFVDFCVPA